MAASGVICVLGDAHLDVVVRPLRPVAADTDTPARTLAGPGGQAANVAAWVAALGGRSRLLYARGTDLAARLVAADLAARGVDLAGPVIEGRTGVVVSLSDGGATRSMLTDRGVGPGFRPEELRAEWLDGCQWLHLPAYSLVTDPVGATARAAVAAAAARQARLSIDLSSTAALAQYGAARFARLLAGLAPDVVFGTEAEMAMIGDLAGPELVVKLGARGVRAGGRHYPAAATDAVDATGAGDAFAAGYLLGGVELGLSAAARAVAAMGGMP
ncbi:MAG TPA: carbohydrate kinase family protein [Streptosporangiaceae bacterium]|jgi:sugar/nucleoside kinase (ribokinase family)